MEASAKRKQEVTRPRGEYQEKEIQRVFGKKNSAKKMKGDSDKPAQAAIVKV